MHFHYLVEAYGGLATIARDFDGHHRQLAETLKGEPAVLPKSRAFAGQFLRPAGIDRAVSPLLAAEITRAGAIRKAPRAAAPFWHRPLRRALLSWLLRRRVANRATVDDTVIGTSISRRVERTALEEIQQGTAPVFVGPWNDSAGTEVLYWIPFLRWVSATYALPPERLIVVSRGGPRAWYGGLAQRYLDARTLFSPSDLEHWLHRTVPQSEQDHKQAVMSPFDAEIVERAARAFELSDYQVLHPSLVFRTISRLRKDRALEQMAQVLRPVRLEAPGRSSLDSLPASFVAVSTAFTSALPKSDENAAFLATLVARLASDHDVVLVDGANPDIPLAPSSRVRPLEVPAGDDLRAAQTLALARASAFVGGYGDLAVIAAFCGTAVLAYHDEKMPPDHAERLAAAAASGWGAVTLERARRFKELHLPVKLHAVKA
jgi:hypothetical protein